MRNLSNDNVVEVNVDGINFLQFKVLLELGVKHGYSLKNDGMDFGHFAENFSREKESYNRLCSVAGLNSENVVKGIQKHTDIVKKISSFCTPEEIGEVDGLITDKNGLVLATTNADCILYLLYDKKNKVIGNIHSGWRGSYQRILENGIDIMINEYGSSCDDIIVCICPSIRKCCFEVGKDVRDMFYDKFSFIDDIDKFIFKQGDKFFVDTVGINNVLLLKKGIKAENIYDSNICSVCNSDKVYSYRVEGKCFKRATAIIGL